MFEKTNAIVLRLAKHTDKASLLHLYTREYGQIACFVHGIHGKKSNNKKALFEPLNLLELEVEHRNNTYRLRESRLVSPLRTIPFDMAKRSITMLLAEVLTNALREPVENPELFDFIYDSILLLDQCETPQNFLLVCMMQLTHHLGILPNTEDAGNTFSLESGTMTHQHPNSSHIIAGDELLLFKQLTTCTYEQMQGLRTTRSQRKTLINAFITYFQFHLPEFHHLKSIDILTEILD